MPGILREVTEHTLKIKPGSKPMKQRMRRFDEGKRRAIGEEIAKLLAAGFIKEVYERRVGNGECVLTTQVSTKYVQRIRFFCHT